MRRWPPGPGSSVISAQGDGAACRHPPKLSAAAHALPLLLPGSPLGSTSHIDGIPPRAEEGHVCPGNGVFSWLRVNWPCGAPVSLASRCKEAARSRTQSPVLTEGWESPARSSLLHVHVVVLKPGGPLVWGAHGEALRLLQPCTGLCRVRPWDPKTKGPPRKSQTSESRSVDTTPCVKGGAPPQNP